MPSEVGLVLKWLRGFHVADRVESLLKLMAYYLTDTRPCCKRGFAFSGGGTSRSSFAVVEAWQPTHGRSASLCHLGRNESRWATGARGVYVRFWQPIVVWWATTTLRNTAEHRIGSWVLSLTCQECPGIVMARRLRGVSIEGRPCADEGQQGNG
jgi:hypothetical protein